MQSERPKHLYLLDILRGLASLTVVVWHYQHFYYVAPDKFSEEFVRSGQPFYAFLKPLYENGHLAVQLFFVLSGFVFYFVYSDAVRNRSVSAYTFLVHRVSRLYPLYFVTLLYVAVLQYGAQAELGSFIVYAYNDVEHFILSLFLATGWGLADGFSFNAPTWSVSVEVLVYAVFFVVVFAIGKSAVVSLMLMAWGCWMVVDGRDVIGWGVFCFFAGGITFQLYEKWRYRFPQARRSGSAEHGRNLLELAEETEPLDQEYA